MKRQSNLPFLDHAVDRRILCGLDPVLRNAGFTGCLDDCRIIRILQDIEDTAVDLPLVRRRSRILDLIHVIEQHTHITQPADTGIRADRRQSIFQPWETEDTFLCLIGFPVEIDFLVRAGRHTMAPAATAVLRDQDYAVFIPLIDGSGWTGRHAGRVQAVVADTRQVLHEQVMELQRNVTSHLLEIVILTGRLAIRQIIFPVRPPFDIHALLSNQRTRTRNRLMVLPLRADERLIVIGPRFIVVIELRLIRMIEELQQALRLRTGTQLQLAILEFPAALPLRLVLPVLRVADARFGLDIVEIHIFRALTVGPDILAGDGARMAANALVKIHDHRNLCFNLQANLPPASCGPPRTYHAGCPSGRNN